MKVIYAVKRGATGYIIAAFRWRVDAEEYASRTNGRCEVVEMVWNHNDPYFRW